MSTGMAGSEERLSASHPAERAVMWDKLHCPHMRAAVRAGFPDLVSVTDEESLLHEIPGSTVLIMRGLEYSEKTAAALATAGNNVRWIQLLSSGYDRLSQHGLRPGITVTNSRGIYSTSVAHHAITLLLAATRCLPQMFNLQREQRWDKAMRERMQPVEDGILVVLGYGSLGQEIGRLAKALGMYVIGIKRNAAQEDHADEVLPVSELHAILPRAAALVISLPGSAETAQMIGEAELALMPRHAVVINVGRGNIINSTALCAALHAGAIAGAALDVTDPEPPPPGHPLWSCPNLLITPHVGQRSGPATARRFAEFVGENIARYLRRQPLLNQVTP